MSERINKDIYPDSEFTFSKALDMDLMKHAEVCIEVGEKATK